MQYFVAAQICEIIKEAKIKWPNDIYIDGKKAGGVLEQNEIMGSVISHTGIGLNFGKMEVEG